MTRFSVEDEEVKMSDKKRKNSSEVEKEKKLQRNGEPKVEEEEEEEDDSEESSGIGNSNGISVTIDPDVLDCSICFEPLRPPLYQCQNGHVACSPCCTKLRQNKCPTCSHSINHSRCLALEKVIESIRVSCSYANYGCTGKLSYAERLSHEATCSYAPCFCPMQNCTFNGSTNQLSTHFNAYHKSSAVNFLYDEPFEVSLDRNEPFRVLHGQHSDIFLLLNDLLLNNMGIGNRLSMICIRSSALECEFLYELTVRGSGSSLQLKASTTNVKKWMGSYPTKIFLLVPWDFCSWKIHLNVCVQRKE